MCNYVFVLIDSGDTKGIFAKDLKKDVLNEDVQKERIMKNVSRLKRNIYVAEGNN